MSQAPYRYFMSTLKAMMTNSVALSIRHHLRIVRTYTGSKAVASVLVKTKMLACISDAWVAFGQRDVVHATIGYG